MKPFTKLAIVAIALGTVTGVAIAQTTPPPALPDPNSFDFTEIRNQILGILGTVLTGLLIWVGNAVRMWLGTKTALANTQSAIALQKQYNEAIHWAMAYAESKAKAMIPGTVQVDNEFLKFGLEFMRDHFPDLTKNISAESIKDSIIARLPTGELTADAKMISAAPAPANA